MLADLHARSFGEKNNRLYEEIRALAPDYILTAGDMILKTQPFDTEETARFLGKRPVCVPSVAATAIMSLSAAGKGRRRHSLRLVYRQPA